MVVQGANVSRLTDSSGKFRFDSLPPGNYQVGVFHPLLDTLGLSLATQPFHLGPDSASYIMLAIPSAATIIKRACPSLGPRAQGTSAVIGALLPLPFIARVQATACNRMGSQLRTFFTGADDEATPAPAGASIAQAKTGRK